MNDIPCGVIRDLLPLYTEDLCSEESKALVESHLKNCSDCRRLKENMKKTEPLPVDSGEGLKKIRKELKNAKKVLENPIFTLVRKAAGLFVKD